MATESMPAEGLWYQAMACVVFPVSVSLPLGSDTLSWTSPFELGKTCRCRIWEA